MEVNNVSYLLIMSGFIILLITFSIGALKVNNDGSMLVDTHIELAKKTMILGSLMIFFGLVSCLF